MITNFQSTKVYIAQGMKSSAYAETTQHLTEALRREKIDCELLPETSSPLHIWARDYMPVQVNENRFVLFRYTPDYLRDYPQYKPNTEAVLAGLGLNVTHSDIVLDGGNVVSCDDKVILTSKIFRENPGWKPKTLIDELSCLLEAEPVIIPEDPHEEYGHADGMVRHTDGPFVLLNNYCDFDKYLRRRLLEALKPHFEVEELHFGAGTKTNWSYLNFLHVGRHVFVPMTEDRYGETALQQISEAFGCNCECHPVAHCDSLVREGGALNCSTWNVCMKKNNV